MVSRGHLVFRLGARTLAVPTSRVARLAEIDRLTAIPSDLESNLGVVIEAGLVVALMDLGALLGEAPRPFRAPSLCVFAHFRRGVAGFAVDEVIGVRHWRPGERSSAIEKLDLDQLEGTPK